MTIYRHQETGKRFHFIHIPRTGGRFINKNILLNGFRCEHKPYNERFECVQIGHFHRHLYEKYLNVKGIPHIAVIRDPLDRFISASRRLRQEYGNKVEELAEDPRFISFLCGSHNDLDNWFRPQIDFLSNTTYIWKYKDGFGSHFSLWMSNILGVPFIIHDVPYEKLGPENHIKVKVNARIIDNIRRFYGDDYAQLDSSLQKGEKTKT